MNQITLYRKGERKPWVFVYNGFNKLYYYRPNKARHYEKEFKHYEMIPYLDPGLQPGVHIFLWESAEANGVSSEDVCVINGLYLSKENIEHDIHADHFKLGNVTITF